MSRGRQFCSFSLNGHLFGIEVGQVLEVLRAARLTSVPLAPAGLAGLINLRGQVMTAFDLRTLLGLGARPAESRPLCIIIRSPEGPLGLLVDVIGDVIDVDEANFETPPDTLRGDGHEFIAGAYKLQNKLLMVLNMDRLILHVSAAADQPPGNPQNRS